MSKKIPSTVPHIVAAENKSESVQARIAADAANAKQRHAKHASEVADKELTRAQEVAYDAKRKLDIANVEAEEASKTAIAALQHQYGLAEDVTPVKPTEPKPDVPPPA